MNRAYLEPRAVGERACNFALCLIGPAAVILFLARNYLP